MAKIVSNHADIGILTDDDACGEDRRDILSDAMKGIPSAKIFSSCFVVPKRRNAIQFAKHLLREGDIILLAGKGHEDVYITNFGKEKWSEKEEIYRN